MKKVFVQYGAGNIGRGFIGALFAKAGWKVRFIDINMEIIDALNRDGAYPVEILSTEKGKAVSKEQIISNVSGVDGRDMEAVADVIASADMMATAVGVNILPFIVPAIAAGLRRRMASRRPLDMIICENMVDADQYVKTLLQKQLSAHEAAWVEQNVGLVEASIGRMVPVMTEEMKKGSVLRVCVEPYSELPIDRAAMKGEIPKIPGLHPFSPFEFYIRRKLYLHNMGHGTTAYLGYLYNCEYIWQAIDIPEIKLIVQRAMLESAGALSRRFQIPLTDITDHIDDLLLRFANCALGDTVARVGRDIGRKLSVGDRFAGALNLCAQQGITPVYIPIGLAAGLCFDNADDKGTAEIRSMIAAKGVEAVLAEYCGLKKESEAWRAVMQYYELLKNWADSKELLAAAEERKKAELALRRVI